jgi:hypothetical protein
MSARPRASRRPAVAADHLRGEEDVLLAGQLGDEVEELEDEADRPRAQRGEPPVARGVDAFAVELDGAVVGAVEPRDQVQEGRLAGARAPDDGDELAALHVELGPVEHATAGPAAAEALHNRTCADRGHASLA